MRCAKFSLLCLLIGTVTISNATVYRDPFSVNEAVSFDFNDGGGVFQKSQTVSKPCMGILAPGDRLGYKNFNFSSGALAVQINVASGMKDDEKAEVNLRLDSFDGPAIATYQIEPTGSWDRWITTTLVFEPENRPTGIHSLFFTFEPPAVKRDVVNIAWFLFFPADIYCSNATQPSCSVQSDSCDSSTSSTDIPVPMTECGKRPRKITVTQTTTTSFSFADNENYDQN